MRSGVITIGIAIAAFFILPNFPRTTSWLSAQEVDLATWRLQEDIGTDDWVSSEQQTFWNGLSLAFKDVKTWLLMFILIGFVSSGGITNFFPTVVETLGYSKINTLLLTAPPYFLAVITSFTNAWHADKTGERYWHVTLPLYVSIAAFIISAATTDDSKYTGPRYLAMMLMPSTVYAGYVVALAWVSNCLPRPPAKRAAALAVANAASNATSIYVSFMVSLHIQEKAQACADHSIVRIQVRAPLCDRNERKLWYGSYSDRICHNPAVCVGQAEQEARSGRRGRWSGDWSRGRDKGSGGSGFQVPHLAHCL